MPEAEKVAEEDRILDEARGAAKSAINLYRVKKRERQNDPKDEQLRDDVWGAMYGFGLKVARETERRVWGEAAVLMEHLYEQAEKNGAIKEHLVKHLGVIRSDAADALRRKAQEVAKEGGDEY